MSGVVAPLREGFATTITFPGAGVTFWEVDEEGIEPIGFDGGAPIDLGTMRDSDPVRPKAPRTRYDVTDSELVVSYDPTFKNTIMDQINTNQQIVTTYPDQSTETWWGFLQKVKFDKLKSGAQPHATITLVATNRNASGVITPPVMVGGVGTAA